ncbi:similar to Saccharomyces cerevisiae YFR018C Putative protein of unknown function [Maudiozyma saulgeensis]|uniref:Peptide hydrolase n=1 Tax=Maudiozyma saulgeensis TaxID=1789683 RepID=A0A1X7R0S4_9SACH|nr:similar to Saccharomyces cerevisiae YFR018C Putative protein of unknown function [Kazachstania saulgeensis]
MTLYKRNACALVFLILSIFFNVTIVQGKFTEYHNKHLSRELSLSKDGKDNLLLPFDVTRTPGSNNSLMIQNFITQHFQTNMKNNWTIEYDNFQENDYNFTNLIFTLDPKEIRQDKDKKYILFAAHYDTLVNIDGFIGAVDSAASCSILLYLSQFLDEIIYEDQYLIDKIVEDNEYGIKIVFFDGEEAIDEWTETDSIYGSRHLAKKWLKDETMSQIELFVLLDLIGGKRTKKITEWKIKSYYKSSHKYYQLLSEIEDNYLENENTIFTKKELFPTDVLYLMMNKVLIEDDHVPFYNANVSILHLIPFPFPEAWHTIDDKFDTLDEDEIQRWAIILSEFAIEVISG